MEEFFESSGNILWLDLLQLCVALASLILSGILMLANLRRGIWRWETDGILMTMIAFLDSVLGVYTIVATVIRMAVPFAAYDDSVWCQINFVFSRVLGISCLNLIMLLSLVRYSVIVFFCKSHPRFWTVVAILSVTTITLATSFRLYGAKLYIFPIKALLQSY
ncbi:hypothetical protein DSO57_1033124 [Entomophthora muscae]|uniref:Uncharacterized protein n=1 Tax=Entomophthora muscae TaxID=34485 RepID=A0ACC2TB34_9FUNG|nr:hypothetical protein DSO57_1033124 [Entomophthora muscae]